VRLRVKIVVSRVEEGACIQPYASPQGRGPDVKSLIPSSTPGR
jgi:hypothetical protein